VVPSGKPESFGIFATGRIAQLVEQLTLNQRVPGSSPGAPTISSEFYLSGALP
jgi:hypothetical protein